MKKSILFFTAMLMLTVSFGFRGSEGKPSIKASQVLIPVANGKSISLLELSTISRSGLQELTGKKMNFFQRMTFKAAQKKLRDDIGADGTLIGKKYQKLGAGMGAAGDSSGFHLGGAALGFFLGIIGVLIAYLAFKDDLKKSRVKWAWIGFAVAFILFGALILL